MTRPGRSGPVAGIQARTYEAREDRPTRPRRAPCRPSLLPGILLNGFELGAMQSRIDSSWTARVDFVKAFRNGFSPLPVKQLRNHPGVALASRHSEPARRNFRSPEQIVGKRYSGLHMLSITEVIPGPSRVGQANAASGHKRNLRSV